MTPNAAYNSGIATGSPVRRIGWALKGAPLRKKDSRLSALAGVVEARKLRDKVSSMMTNAGASPEDAMVLCVFAKPDMSALVPEVLVLPPKDNGTDLEGAVKHADKLPVGFLVFILDHSDPKHFSLISHARPLIVEDPRGPVFNETARLSYENSIKQRLIAKGQIPDYRD